MELCFLFPADDNIDLPYIVKRSKHDRPFELSKDNRTEREKARDRERERDKAPPYRREAVRLGHQTRPARPDIVCTGPRNGSVKPSDGYTELDRGDTRLSPTPAFMGLVFLCVDLFGLWSLRSPRRLLGTTGWLLRTSVT